MPEDPKGGGATTIDQLGDQLKTHLDKTVGEPLKALTSKVEDHAKRFEDLEAAAKAAKEQHDVEIKALADANRKGQFDFVPSDDPADPGNPSLAKMLLGHMARWEGDTKEFKRERELAHEGAEWVQKTVGQQAGIGQYGGLLVPTSMFPGIMGALRPASTLVSAMQAGGAGANVLEGLTGGPIQFNRGEGGLTATRKGESAPGPAPGRETFEAMELKPLEIMARVTTSNALLRQDSSGVIGRWLEQRLGQEIGIRADRDGYLGAGTPEPIGMANTPTSVEAGKPAATTSWGSVDYLGADQNVSDLLEDMKVARKGRDVGPEFGEAMWFANPQGFSKIRKTKDADGKPLELFDKKFGSAGAGVADDRLVGHRYVESTQLTYGTTGDVLWLAPVGAMYWAMWGAIEIVANPFSATEFANNDLQIRAVAYHDFGFLRGSLMQKATGWNNS